MALDVFGMCNALHDIQALVDDAVLNELGIAKGGMFLLDEGQHAALLPRVRDHVVNSTPGGSGANTMLGIALLGGRSCFTSRVGPDDYGIQYRTGLRSNFVQANLATGGGPTGICVVLITPDKQRTMCTFLGEARELGPADVSDTDIRASAYLYVTGYLWDLPNQQQAVRKAMDTARSAGVRVALSLSDTFCIERHRTEFAGLVEEYVDVVFANRDEALALSGQPNVEAAAAWFVDRVDIAAITRDSTGSVLATGTASIDVPAHTVTAVDTTGAGDMYAAGMLYGLTRGLPIDACGRIASYTAAMVVAQLGPRLLSIDHDALARLTTG